MRFSQTGSKKLQRRLIPSTASLTAFDAVSRLGSFSAAAQALDLTPGAISRQIAALEEQLGATLLLRNNKGVVLTERGQRYAKGISDIITRLRILSLEAMAQDTPNVLRLAFPPTFGTRWLLPRIPDYVKKHPQTTLSFSTRIGQIDFEREELDAAIHVGTADWPGCNHQLLLKEMVVPVCSPDFLLQNPIKSPAALLKLPLLEMASRPQGWKFWFSHFGIAEPHREGMRFEQFLNVSQACRAGLGVALMPLFLIEGELASGQLVKALKPPIESESAYYFITPHEKTANAGVVSFRNWLTQEIRLFQTTET
ncbi:LysR substrate-binding domain-containing protein [Aquamicrobium segne]|uniref:LysR substrate-binding domain-containing protein n=1 Tax=Aquamicrobium segne TaxID=469547 RepID=A0ABW0GXL5_9HYPH